MILVVAVAVLVAQTDPVSSDVNWAQLAIAVVAAAATLGAAYLGVHAKRRGEKVDQSAVLLEGYDEFVAHLQAEAQANSARLDKLEEDLLRCHAERQATQALVRRLLAHFGLPDDFDPQVPPPEPPGSPA